MQVWDEIRLADNAIEMVQTGNLLVTRFDGKPETWNTKPPLQIWLEALSVKLFGIRNLAFRLPSALAALATVLLLFAFVRRRLHDLWAASLAGVLLLSSTGFVLVHVARNGEYDALLVLWMLAASLAFYKFVWRLEEKWIWLTALFMVLAVYTKGIQGLILLPGLLAYAGAARRFRAVFRERKLYIAAGVALATIALYYVAREHLQPGYLHAVWQNELFGRYGEVNEGHNGPFYAYFLSLGWWMVILVYGVLCLRIMKGEDRRLGIFAIVVASSYLLVISFSKTKLEWYVAPVYPFLSLLAVVTIRSLMAVRPKATWTRPVLIALTCVVAVWSASAMTSKIDKRAHPYTADERLPVQLAAFRRAFPGTKRVVLGTPSYIGPSIYYQQFFAKRGLAIELAAPRGIELHPGETFLTSVVQIKRRLRGEDNAKEIFSFEGMDGFREASRSTVGVAPHSR